MDTLSESKRNKMFGNFRHDYKEAKKAKKIIDSQIREWVDAYESVERDRFGDKIDSSDGTNRSKIQMREIAKHIELQKPNLTHPFISALSPIRVSSPMNNDAARTTARWLNSVFTAEYDRVKMVNQAVDIFLREGTVWAHTPWREKTIKIESETQPMTIEQIAVEYPDAEKIISNDDGTYSVTIEEDLKVENRPDIEILRNEDVFPDPSATSEDDMLFLVRRRKMTYTEISELPDLITGALEKLKGSETNDNHESELGNARKTRLEDFGRGEYKAQDNARKQYDVLEYWGYYDVDGTGSLTPVLAMWEENNDVSLVMGESPMPHGKIPFHSAVYSQTSFSLWGLAPAFFLKENQQAKTGLMRGIMDNMSLANNGQKFIVRGGINYVNMKRMREGNRIIEINRPGAIEDGSYNNLPNSVFSVMEMTDKENIDLMGVNPSGEALTGKQFGSDSNQAVVTMSQQRMISSVEVLGDFYAKCFKDWIAMGHVFLEEEQILAAHEQGMQPNYNALLISSTAHISMMVGTMVSRNIKLQQLNMLMQQAKTLEKAAPPDLIPNLIAEMFDSFELFDKADEIREYKPEPSQEETMMMQLEIAKKQAEVAKLQKEAELMDMNVKASYINAQARMAEVQANLAHTGAKTENEHAKAQATRVDTALKPVSAEAEIGMKEAALQKTLSEKDVKGETKQRS